MDMHQTMIEFGRLDNGIMGLFSYALMFLGWVCTLGTLGLLCAKISRWFKNRGVVRYCTDKYRSLGSVGPKGYYYIVLGIYMGQCGNMISDGVSAYGTAGLEGYVWPVMLGCIQGMLIIPICELIRIAGTLIIKRFNESRCIR